MENKLIFEAVANAMAEVKAVGKNQKNLQQNYSYRGIDDIANEMHTILSKYKIFVTPEIMEHTREERQSAKGGTLIYSIIKVRYTFWTVDGSTVKCVVMGEGMDSGDKATNKALAGAYKYALTQIFCIPTADTKENEQETPQPMKEPQEEEKKIIPIQAKGGATKNQVNVINKMIEGKEDKKERIQKAFNVATLEELTKAQASEVISKLYENKAM